jgi:ABC-type sugar transport system permease subunit
MGAMNSISESIVESAKIEGANSIQEFFFITIPMIFSTITTFLVVGIAGIFASQMNLFSFYGTDADAHLYTVGYYLYASTAKATFADYPRLSAFGLVLSAVAVPITYSVKYLLEKFGPKT